MEKIWVALRGTVSMLHRYLPKMVAVLCIISLLATAYDFFRLPPQDDLWKGHYAGCGNFSDIKLGADRFEQDTLALRIKDAQPAKFTVSGELGISKKTYLSYLEKAEKILIEITPLQTHPSFYIPFPDFIELEKPSGVSVGDRGITLKLKEKELQVHGDITQYPFDNYLIGFSAEVMVTYKNDPQYHSLPVEVSIVNTMLSNVFVVREARTNNEFMNDASDPAAMVRYETNQCALIVERSPWYKAMVLFLVTLIFVPAIYSVYKTDSDPGVELIAAILGVAAIRSYLLGIPADWIIYPIDVVFAAAVMFTAVIPLWRIGEAKKP
ncbi:MAG: hypothetical protein WA056_07790 [Gallionella sp.]